ncbi:Uncharacterised protein [Bordetella pertussis]|nr:Uncharacterised protein [Bordetella pertussis]
MPSTQPSLALALASMRRYWPRPPGSPANCRLRPTDAWRAPYEPRRSWPS